MTVVCSADAVWKPPSLAPISAMAEAADDGGAISLKSPFLRLFNCTFAGNHTQGQGVAIHGSFGSRVILANCLFTGDLAATNGGAVSLL